MGELGLSDLYKIEKEVPVKDKQGNEVKILMRTISDADKREAREAGREARADLLVKLEDPKSKESVLLRETLGKLSVESVKRELAIHKISSLAKRDEISNKIKSRDKFKNVAEDSEEFLLAMDDAVDKEVSKIAANLKGSSDVLKKELQEIKVNLMLDSIFVEAFNELVLLYAIRDKANPDNPLFETVQGMTKCFRGDIREQLRVGYYNLDSKDADDVKK